MNFFLQIYINKLLVIHLLFKIPFFFFLQTAIPIPFIQILTTLRRIQVFYFQLNSIPIILIKKIKCAFLLVDYSFLI